MFQKKTSLCLLKPSSCKPLNGGEHPMDEIDSQLWICRVMLITIREMAQFAMK
ncbi:MAG: hypothetical protein ACI9W7_001397 [Porticoccaceae bacterium]|jgi:hypothetical protein